MLFDMSAKYLVLLLGVGAAYTTASNLRQRRAAALFGRDDGARQSTHQLRHPSSASFDSVGQGERGAADEEITAATASTTKAPSLAMDKSAYAEGESIVVTVSVGSPSHPYYSSSDAPSLAVDRNYHEWSVGLFMRDADPQGGTLPPIVSINLCGALGEDCDADDRGYVSYADVTVTFGSERQDLMQGRWPLEVSEYGTGFDAYVLDGRGAAAIGPLEFYVRSEDDSSGSGPVEYRPKGSAEVSPRPRIPGDVADARHPLMRYRKGITKATERKHASMAKPARAAPTIGKDIAPPSEPSGDEAAAVEGGGNADGRPLGVMTANKEEYEQDESVSIDFSINQSLATSGEDLSNYKIGIFMRMAHPQGGELPPVVSLPLCPADGPGKCDGKDGAIAGTVTFSGETADRMAGSGWPIDLYQWGTGYDAYILDGAGDGVVGPIKFNIVMNDA